MADRPVLVWLRQDLRLGDHPALTAAVATGAPVLPFYVLDDATPGSWRMGGASRWWLHHSLASLGAAVEQRGGALWLGRGAALEVIPALARKLKAGAVHLTRSYEPWAGKLEQQVREALASDGIGCKRFPGALLREPEEIRTFAGEPFRVYTPFWRALASAGEPGPVLPPPAEIARPPRIPKSDRLDNWQLLPKRPNWAEGFAPVWRPGEEGAAQRLEGFLASIADYADERNRPDLPSTSRLSPHLHFGEISPRACWHAVRAAAARRNGRGDKGGETFLRELVWREFSYNLLFHWPDLPEKPFRREFGAFPWSSDAVRLRAWQRGRTGFPIVDAGMRELWATGWMHNRVRMIAASFLVKDLLVPWQAGEEWFWDTLVDADLASNAASWQWVAGSGADAAPYFRIFNPVKQGTTFDPEGSYVRRWVPELARLPLAYLHAPWTAPEDVLAEAGVVLGRTYPPPIIDHVKARDEALAAFARIKSA